MTRVLMALMLLLGAAVEAADTPAPAPDPERPEYRARELPKDTFKPSEKVQEDFPVPFPEDI